jgi:glycine cleavage system H protein
MSENIPKDLKYTREHEWARPKGNVIAVGVTDHAQSTLGDIVYVELPKVGSTLTEGKQFGVIESTKAVSELYAPITGKVVNVNQALVDNPSTVNTDPYGAGWILEVEPSDSKQLDALMDSAAYSELLKNA